MDPLRDSVRDRCCLTLCTFFCVRLRIYHILGRGVCAMRCRLICHLPVLVSKLLASFRICRYHIYFWHRLDPRILYVLLGVHVRSCRTRRRGCHGVLHEECNLAVTSFLKRDSNKGYFLLLCRISLMKQTNSRCKHRAAALRYPISKRD